MHKRKLFKILVAVPVLASDPAGNIRNKPDAGCGYSCIDSSDKFRGHRTVVLGDLRWSLKP